MAFKDNEIDIRDLQTATISVGDLRAIVTATKALERLQKLYRRE